jgi:hypothetical protein
MALPRRPGVLVRAPEVLHPDEEVPIIVRLVARRAVKIGDVTVTLLERRRLRAPAGGVPAGRSEEPRAFEVLRGPAGLRPGTTDLSGTLRVGEAWPTHRGDLIDVTHWLQVHVDVPWWPDAARELPVLVRRRRPAAGAGEAVAGAGADLPAAGAQMRGEQGRLRVALDRTVVSPGDELTGWWQVKRRRGVGSVALRLVRREYAGARTAEAVRPLVAHSGGAKGGRHGFRLSMPADLALSTDAGAWRVEWMLEAAADAAADWLVRIPLTVLPAPEAGTAVWHGGLLTRSMRESWRAVAQRVGLALDADDTLVGARGSVAVALRAESAGRRAELVAELRWPSLGLNLSSRGAAGDGDRAARTSPPLAVVLPDAREWARSSELRAREPAQAAALLSGNLARALRGLAARGTVGLDDGGARCVRAWSGAAADLEDVAGAAVRLAEAMDAARVNVPPPTAFGAPGVLPRWHALAARVEGVLQPGCMRVSGRTPAGAVEIETRLGARGVPLDTIVRVRPVPPLPKGWLVPDARTAGKDGAGRRRERRAANTRGFAPAASEALAWLEERHGPLTLSPEEVALRLPAPLLDPTPAVMALDAITRFCTALQGKPDGPYR